jgi:hypothetical protein
LRCGEGNFFASNVPLGRHDAEASSSGAFVLSGAIGRVLSEVWEGEAGRHERGGRSRGSGGRREPSQRCHPAPHDSPTGRLAPPSSRWGSAHRGRSSEVSALQSLVQVVNLWLWEIGCLSGGSGWVLQCRCVQESDHNA